MADETKKPSITAKLRDAASRGPRYFLGKTLHKLGLKELGRAEIAGRTFRVPLGDDGIHQLFAESEPWLAPLVRKLLAGRDGCIVDVGANVGQTLLMCKAVAPERAYFGFEPSTSCVAVLRKIIAVNALENAEVIHGALSNEAGTATLYADNPSDPAGSIVAGFREGPEYHGGESEVVRLIDGANIKAKLSPCALVKIDVEGAELEVLAGLKSLLVDEKPPVICEVLPVYDEQSESGARRMARQLEIEELLTEIGYRIQRIKTDGESVAIDSFGVHDVLEDSNYLFLPA
ncbi:FkbM family methyltransferase [Planctomycetota bacterium]|nr:FkbM family methyltransferase [Planctomycetota bacterium]